MNTHETRTSAKIVIVGGIRAPNRISTLQPGPRADEIALRLINMERLTDIPPTQASSDPTEAAQRAFLTLLFNRYRGALLRHIGRLTASREDAADLMQETYLRVMDRIHINEFDAEARGYLFRTATNLARDHYRRQRFRACARLDDSPEEFLCAADPTPEQACVAHQVTVTMQAALREMPTDARDVFVLARSRDLGNAEIARHLCISLRTVERRMATAMTFISDRFRCHT
jgi:RNA polymerase sigma factor (sigma-70 family)